MQEDYKRLIEEIRDVYFIIQQERLVMVSNYTAELYGYSRDELIGKPFLELIVPEERERLSEYYKRRTQGQQVPERYESVFLTSNGRRIPGKVSVWSTCFRDQPAIAGIVMDISERKAIMEKLQDSEEKYRNIVENSPDIIYTADPEGVILSVNGAVRNILGYTPEEVIGRKFMDFIPPRAISRVMEDHVQLCSGNNVTSCTLTLNKDGAERTLEFRSVPLLKDGTAVKAQGMLRDITDSMKAEEKLNRMFESVTDGVTVTDLKGFITELNQKTVEMYGFESKDQMLGRNVLNFIAPYDHRKAIDNMKRTLELGLVRDIEYRLIRQDGSEFYAELSASILMDAFCKPEGYIAILRDITERRQAEIALRESEELFSKVFYHNPTAMAISTLPEGRILYANDSFLRLIGYSKAEVIGHTSLDIKIFEGHSERKQLIRELLVDTGNSGKEMLVQTKTGKILTVLAWGKEVSINEQPHFISMAVDITERKQMEEKYRQLLEDMSDGFGIIQHGKFVFVNRRMGEIFGYEPEQILGKPVEYWMQPEVRQIKMSEFERVIRGESTPREREVGEIVRGDGKRVVVESSIKKIQYQDEIAFSVIYRDITERKEMEGLLRERAHQLSALSQRLIEVQEKERKEIGHALHDEVGGSLIMLQLAISQLMQKHSEVGVAVFDKINQIVDELSNQIRYISQSLRPSILDDFGLLDAIHSHLKLFEERTGIVTSFTHSTLEGRLPPQIETLAYRIIQESLNNAAKHSGTENIDVRLTYEDASLNISVEDRGCGLDPEQTSLGTGLVGMQDLAELVGGSLTINSSPGEGTQISCKLPVKLANDN